VAAGLSFAIFAGVAAEHAAHPDPGGQRLAVEFRGPQVFLTPPEHSEERAPLTEYVGSEVMVVASTSVASRHLGVLWNERESLGVNVRGA
jgi:hypothetical protein